jgi:outer membrane immunogenic protein
MKKQLIIAFTAASSLLSMTAKADDNLNNWAGFYGGVNIGHASGTNHADRLTGGEGSFSHISGGFGGAQIGYNFQADRIIYGLEVDIQKSDISGKTVNSNASSDMYSDNYRAQKIDWFSTVRGRFGYSFGNFLLYGTGGIAIADVKANVTNTDSNPVNEKQTQHGWIAGAGAEWAFDKNWILDAQYLRISLDKKDFHFNDSINLTNQNNSDFNVFKLGINYKF